MKRQITYLFFLLLTFPTFGQHENCNGMDRVASIFRDSICDTIIPNGTRKLICEDPADPRFGQNIIDTTRSMAATILRDQYFKTCLKGKSREFVISILGEGRMINEERNDGGDSKYTIIYSLQMYDEKGNASDPLPSILYVYFDENSHASAMSVISY